MRRSRKKRKYVNILPSLLTVGNMYCGLLSIVYTINGRFELAAWLILLALLFDGSDGHIARITRSTSNFGKELDSLADVITFGVAPAVLVYRSVLHDFEHSGIFIVTVYAITGALRLARYNVQAGTAVKSFTGLPIPGAGCLIASTVLLQLKYDHPLLQDYLPPVFALFILLLAFLMVSTVKYPKRELFLVRRNRAFQYMFIIILLFSIIKLRPTLFVFMMFLAYVTVGPINYLSRNRLEQEPLPQEHEGPVS
ncbi:MAG: CDP-diacylglycerol--serine O-phosphatidyltransferase [Candidatus Abyssobacteria bacterium SURF_17]|uniref:CDP-diacylglycerol--serine O-phosphatidyltransferase n=1 Tax=Candidatus Abyssobacteria bacterium SURF_17 TaxID=2093361 RepID=A0A419F0E6_9BACT|nr:MAG: CDP-diacylglycerol--serine O-phosphatidyltransferase [Candidatus Abyssubacteria bacterium SURF_17]